MNIAVFGSVRSDSVPPMEHREEFRGFCYNLGKKLAGIPHVSLHVASDRERTADNWIVQGFAKAITKPAGPRVAIYPRRKGYPFRDLRKEKPWLFTRVPAPEARKAVTAHLRMLRAADAALLVGGNDGVVNAGLAAMLTRVRLWPVGYFGGGTSQFQLDAASLSGVTARMPAPAVAARLNSSAQSAIEAVHAEAMAFPRVMVVHGRSDDRKAVVTLLNRSGVTDVGVLVDQSEPGAVIVEEFERRASLSDAAVAVITPDDMVVDTRDAANQPIDITLDSATLRARQNVVLEYGWFWARLGRGRTLLLVKGDVEIPSDLYGVVMVKYKNTPEEREAESQIQRFLDRIRRGGTG